MHVFFFLSLRAERVDQLCWREEPSSDLEDLDELIALLHASAAEADERQAKWKTMLCALILGPRQLSLRG